MILADTWFLSYFKTSSIAAKVEPEYVAHTNVN